MKNYLDIITKLISITQNLPKAVEVLKNVKEFFHETGIDDIRQTVEDINEKILSVDDTQNTEMEKLKEVMYEAEDLLDELATLVQQNRPLDVGDRVTEIFNRCKSFCNFYWLSLGIKDLKKKLDDACKAYDEKFGFKHDPQSITKEKYETKSDKDDKIIGREEDVKKIVDILKTRVVQNNPSFFTIVGIGGLGKTALARLVLDDKDVKEAFDLRLWGCVSDHEQKKLDVQQVLDKIQEVREPGDDDGSTSNDERNKLEEKLKGKRYLLVLDDVWTEKREEWCKLVPYFAGGGGGSWVLVTTRSQKTATIIGADEVRHTHKLGGLSKENIWCLFKRFAFTPAQSNLPDDHELVICGKEILGGCNGNPLAIRVIGTLLFDRSTNEWKSVKKIGSSNKQKDEEKGIMRILKTSYHYLESPLKRCFTYCALFPKDYEIEKEMLIHLWMAHGYVDPIYVGQTVEHTAEEYFTTLVKRCFFQDISRDKSGDIISCKMHDLMHDMARIVSGKEIYASNANGDEEINKNVRHFSVLLSYNRQNSSNMTHLSHFRRLRSYVHLTRSGFMDADRSFVEALISTCRFLRALSLSGLRQMESLPDSLSTLSHLRYLDLSYNSELVVLPDSISELYDLQTLILRECYKLEKLPKEFSKLVKLRSLDISGNCLKYMPSDMDKLTCLYSLSNFIVGNEGDFVSWNQWFAGFKDLKVPKGIKGKLDVNIRWPYTEIVATDDVNIRKDYYFLACTEHLHSIEICFQYDGDDDVEDEDDDDDGEMSGEITRVGNEEEMDEGDDDGKMSGEITRVGNEEEMDEGDDDGKMSGEITRVGNEEEMDEDDDDDGEMSGESTRVGNEEEMDDDYRSIALMENLHPHTNLKKLRVSRYHGTGMPQWVFLLSELEELYLYRCKFLKNWRRKIAWASDDYLCEFLPEEIGNNGGQLPSLPKLKKLKIKNCPKLTWIPWCPKLEKLSLKEFDSQLKFEQSSPECAPFEVRNISIDRATWLNDSLHVGAFKCLEKLKIENDNMMTNLGEVENVFQSSSRLKILHIYDCEELEGIVDGGLEHLTSLKELYIDGCKSILFEDGEAEPSPILPSLQTLTLTFLPTLKILPNWMQSLTGLQTLSIRHSQKLTKIPTWMTSLTRLQTLEIRSCLKSLETRCKEEDLPLVQHIPHRLFMLNNYPIPPDEVLEILRRHDLTHLTHFLFTASELEGIVDRGLEHLTSDPTLRVSDS